MTTRIVFDGRSSGVNFGYKRAVDDESDGLPVRRVKESTRDVGAEINSALAANAKFVIFTDAETGKEFSLEPERVKSIEAE